MTMHEPLAPATVAPVDDGLGWLLTRFVERVAGVSGALLVSRDGLKMAVSGLDIDQADKAAAWMASLHSLARSAGPISGSASGGFRQAVVEDDGVLVFVMSADHAVAGQTSDRIGLVGSVLGVLAHPDADPNTVGFEMGLLVKSVADHLVTATRSGESTDGVR
ncbi:roadblock/LC7 domain-containing protein [Spirillospora sp. NPDC048823]|uniref:roadblock/LC7 domain-containing protein n=1 Tax=unclassified Spirillospora TaxID=2642701 RepID=UPI00371BDFE1